MQTPRKMTLDELRAAMERYRNEECSQGPGGLRRHKCGAVLRAVLVYLSIHDSPFQGTCAGSGRVARILIPYCPYCEEKPDEYGCLHFPTILTTSELNRIAQGERP